MREEDPCEAERTVKRVRRTDDPQAPKPVTDTQCLQHARLAAMYRDTKCDQAYAPLHVLSHVKGQFAATPAYSSWIDTRPSPTAYIPYDEDERAYRQELAEKEAGQQHKGGERVVGWDEARLREQELESRHMIRPVLTPSRQRKTTPVDVSSVLMDGANRTQHEVGGAAARPAHYPATPSRVRAKPGQPNVAHSGAPAMEDRGDSLMVL